MCECELEGSRTRHFKKVFKALFQGDNKIAREDFLICLFLWELFGKKKIQTDYVRAMHGPYPILLVDKSPSEEEEEKRVDWFSRDEEVG